MKLVLTAFLMTLIVCGVTLANSVHFSWTQPEPVIVINSDGTITPSTAPIKQTGDTYSVTGDVTEEIWVGISNIVLDGNGHNISRPIYVTGESNLTIQNWKISGGNNIGLFSVSNVSVLNNTLTGGDLPWYETGAITVDNSSSVEIVGNTITNGDIGILMTGSKDNLIMKNTITGMSTGWDHASAGIMLYNSSNNIIHHNNFINDTFGAGIEGLNSVNNSWDGGSPSGGNYWSDYQSKYPNASEVDNSGIWNTPYVIDANNTDYQPLINQVNITTSPSTPTPSPTPTLSPTPSPSVPELPTWITVPAVITATLIIIAYLKRQTNQSEPEA